MVKLHARARPVIDSMLDQGAVEPLRAAAQMLHPRPKVMSAEESLPADLRRAVHEDVAHDLRWIAYQMREAARTLDHASTVVSGAVKVSPETRAWFAAALRALGSRICEHARISSDGSCRYCDKPHAEESPSWNGKI